MVETQPHPSAVQPSQLRGHPVDRRHPPRVRGQRLFCLDLLQRRPPEAESLATSAWVKSSDSRSRRRSAVSAGPGCSRSWKPSPSAAASRTWVDGLGACAPVSQAFTEAALTKRMGAHGSNLRLFPQPVQSCKYGEGLTSTHRNGAYDLQDLGDLA